MKIIFYSINIGLCDDKGLKWLLIQKSYHMFPYLGEVIQGYLVSKLRKRLALEYFSIDNATATQLQK